MSFINSHRFGKKKPMLFTISVADGESFTMPHQTYIINLFDYIVEWGDGDSNTVTSATDVNSTHTYVTAGSYQISIKGACEAFSFNNTGNNLNLISVESLGNIVFITLDFYGCSNMTSFISGVDVNTSNIISLYNLFYLCSSLTLLECDLWDTSNVVSLENSFFHTGSLLDYSSIYNWDTSSVTTMNQTFRNCAVVVELDLSSWDVSNVTTTANLFLQCYKLTTLNVANWDVSKVTDFGATFIYCYVLDNLDVSLWNTSSGTSFYQMFHYCFALTSLDLSNWDVSNATILYGMFRRTYKLTTVGDLSSWDLSKVTNVAYMFAHETGSVITDLAIPAWWTSYPLITSHALCFNANTSRPNYADIPVDWK